jgi:pantetheine-phosphate adenylyltransferase
MIRTAFYPGSFDPLTNGHLDVIGRALGLFDRLVVGVGDHHGKEPMLEVAARLALIEDVAAPLASAAGAVLDVVSFDGLVVDAARDAGAGALVRGIRDGSDFDYEMRMAHMNQSMAAGLETIFLAAAPRVGFISSTLVRQIAAMGGDISGFVPGASARAVAAALGRQSV